LHERGIRTGAVPQDSWYLKPMTQALADHFSAK